MLSKSAVVSSLVFLGAVQVHGAAIQKRECMDDPAACLGQAHHDLSSVWSAGAPYASSAVAHASPIVSSALSVASSGAASVSSRIAEGPRATFILPKRECMDDPAACLSQAHHDLSSVWSAGAPYASSAVANHPGPRVTPVPEKRDCMDDPQACLAQGQGDLSSVWSKGQPYASSAISAGVVSSALNVASSDVSSALSEAHSDASSVWSRVVNGPGGAQATGLVEYVSVVNGQSVTAVSSSNGPVITLAPSGQGTPTTFGGVVFTAATGNVLAASPAASGSAGSSSSDNSAGFKAGVPSFVMGLAALAGAFLAL